ncbi:MAG: hypothetical protein FWF59_15405 [Turicibacter sp.]|nr:hypothetical protein [Turicibacter sp.]
MEETALSRLKGQYPALSYSKDGDENLWAAAGSECWVLENESRYIIAYLRGWEKNCGRYCEQWGLYGIDQDYQLACSAIASIESYKFASLGSVFSKYYEMSGDGTY